jgi:esterase/lipase superfamily enzyme
MITTRDVLFYKDIEGKGYGNGTYSFLNTSNLKNACPSEVTIFVHGWDNNETKPKERLDRIKMSLEKNNYNYPLIGFTWESDTEWNAAKSLAKWNGPLLASFISSLKTWCEKDQTSTEDIKVRLIAHSLGARVVLSSLDSLHKDPLWNKKNYDVKSVDFLGTAIDDEEISKNSSEVLNDFANWGTLKSDYGKAIEDEVTSFNNYFNPSD